MEAPPVSGDQVVKSIYFVDSDMRLKSCPFNEPAGYSTTVENFKL
jgi:hypothetical protein